MEIDYGLAWDFLDDHDSRPYQLRFRRNGWFDDTGQLIAVVAKFDHPDTDTHPAHQPSRRRLQRRRAGHRRLAELGPNYRLHRQSRRYPPPPHRRRARLTPPPERNPP
ncbi:hypothetical protein [Mycolicibacterium poriferae]|uniref:Uncharacterized protein n=1 Tax=Mycolicibacterium poriferae TaxID=39694 RepID=A0A6N4VFW7_9MYCO|nr:hypothetical protein [Mycolicibacterium poriferae]BBX54652.1 hypothetical protein MPOR_56780 [Mycolicibacterium poriferae]